MAIIDRYKAAKVPLQPRKTKIDTTPEPKDRRDALSIHPPYLWKVRKR
jgi:hypothetical protein